ncbi:MAG: deoxynucleoside kinase [Bacteroidetes bacterium]|nr:deoxynucleoside kinase [Bacteroidota bacterium]
MKNLRYIAIEGNIGAGKSTLAEMLARRTGSVYVREQFEDNPFLGDFYSDMERYAFAAELSFLEERLRNVRDAIKRNESVVADYFWEKSLVFARVNLKGEELKLFERISSSFSVQAKIPDIIVYLHRPAEKLLKHINKRGREFEQQIAKEYLAKVAAGYSSFFAAEKRMPVLWINNELGPEALTQHVLNLVQKNYSPGLHLIPELQ